MLALKCRWQWQHWLWLPVLVSGILPEVDLLGGPLPVDSSADGSDEDYGRVIDLAVNGTTNPTDDVGPVHEKGLNSSNVTVSQFASHVSEFASQVLGDQSTKSETRSSISRASAAADVPQVSDSGGDENDHHDVGDSGSSQHDSSNGTVMEQLFRVQLGALRQENEALHTALSHSTESAASMDKELAKAENKRAEAEAAQHASEERAQQEHDELDAMGKKLHVFEVQHVAAMQKVQLEKHSLEVNLSATQNQTLELQNQLRTAIESGKVALSAAEKQEAALTAGLQTARAGEDKYHRKTIALEKSLSQLRQANAHLRTSLRQRAQQLHKSETKRLRVEGALDHTEKELTKLTKRKGSEQWFEEQVSALRAAQQNATRDAKFSREARDAEQSLLDEANRDRKNLSAKLVVLNRSSEQRIHRLTAALAESRAQIQSVESNSSKAWQMMGHLRSALKDAEQRRKAAETAAGETVNRSAVIKQFADTEVQRAQKEAEDADLAAGKAVTRATRAEGQLAALRRDLQAVKMERDEVKLSQKQEIQSARDLAAEVQRLRNDLADSKARLAHSEQHAATLQAQFDAVGDLGVPKGSTGHTSGTAMKHSKKQQSTRDRMKLSLSLIERATTDAANQMQQTHENEDKDESQKRAAVMSSDADRLQALLS